MLYIPIDLKYNKPKTQKRDDHMAQIDSLLKHINSNRNLSYLEDIYDLYDFIPNSDLRAVLAALHTSLNNWFNVMNSDCKGKEKWRNFRFSLFSLPYCVLFGLY